ncbi:MAG: hypothetical protein QXO75_08090 [Nitrososphaerota archaeon]
MRLLSKNRQYFINDPLKFMKDAVEWSAFPLLLSDLCYNYTHVGAGFNIPIVLVD